MGRRAVATSDQAVLRGRLIDLICERCTPSTKRIVIIMDEIQNISPDIYGLITSTHDTLQKKGYIPFLLCIGQPELRSTVKNLAKNLAIMGRQFQSLQEFHGLSFIQIAEFLESLEGEDRHFTKKHFPARAGKDWSITQLVAPLEQAVLSVVDLKSMRLELRFPMGYLRQTLNYLFLLLGDSEFADMQITPKEVLDAFDANNFRNLLLSYASPIQS